MKPGIALEKLWHASRCGTAIFSAEACRGRRDGGRYEFTVCVYPLPDGSHWWMLWKSNLPGNVLSTAIAGGRFKTKSPGTVRSWRRSG